MEEGTEKLVTALIKHIHDSSLVPTTTLTELMTVNNVSKPGKMSREDLESYTIDVLNLIDYKTYLPQRIPLTQNFMEDVLDPIMTVPVPTGRYRVTMRKLLRLSLAQLQQQAELMKLDVLDLDEEGIAALILINMNDESPIIVALARMLLAKEVAYVYGIRFQIPIRGPAHPSSTVNLVIKPWDMVQDLELTKDDLLKECENQGIAVNRKESKRQLAIRLIAWWTAHPDQMREPFMPGFATFLLETARRHVSSP